MQWEDLTAPDFAAAVKKAQGVCVLPLACIEKHGDHLPLGTDLFLGMEIARRAAGMESAVVFPPFYLTQILEARHQPGTIAVGGLVMLQLLEAVCDEIGRNGLRKIILLVTHGGNRFLAPFFVQLGLEKRKEYMVYLSQSYWDPGFRELKEELLESEFSSHAGEMETSMVLAARPELVRMDKIDQHSGQPQKRGRHLTGLMPTQETPICWYADYPDHYAGDARPATAEKGERMLQFLAERLVEVIRSVKKDTTTQKLYEEFFSRTEH